MSEAAGRAAPTRPAGRREQAKALKRGRILAAAQRRLASQGYEGMTMAQVAHDADVAIGTVFQYAATKPELLMMVAADRWSDTIPALIAQARDTDDPVEIILTLLSPLARESARAPEVTMAMAREILFGVDGPHRREVLALVTRLEEAIAGVLRSHGAGAAADTAGTAARLIVSGGLIELNRTRTGLAGGDPVEHRLRAMVELALAGSRAGV